MIKKMKKVNPQMWNQYIGRIWAKLLVYNKIKKNGVLVEIAPGEINKIGYALNFYNFKGTLYVVEPNKKSLRIITKKYRNLLKEVKIIPVNHPLDKAIKFLPGKVDAILANHPLDDMVLGNYLVKASFYKYFSDEYEISPEKSRKMWKAILMNPKKLLKVKLKLVKNWIKLIEQTHALFVIISQYQSHYFQKNKIFDPDRVGYDVLKRIKSFYITEKIPMEISREFKNPERWAVIRNEKKGII